MCFHAYLLLMVVILRRFRKEDVLPGSFSVMNPYEKDAIMTLEAVDVIPAHGYILS